ncbi:OLC1v1026887C1 [Oldenlandia corymbosa var. corymbosa]|uniref:mannosyl-glycoprotein endo-beta-N-acetylglucosaminidase n=1 Tax=Oldenlandia corymbosa var. corymbosa TaxID=529605 RepID=A0AAV1C8U6_OLDCO|nr:OLC1v1026887C1 [Oldenlandia corymbosa var. corymbosa]
MLDRFRAYIRRTYDRHRHRPTFRFLKLLLHFFLSAIMEGVVVSPSHVQPEPSSDPPPFDPKQPGVPISYPLKTLEELESRSYFDSFHYPFNKSRVKLQSAKSDGSPLMPQRPRILVCHDMQGGYVDDKWIQGGSNADAYSIWHWYLIDVFVYFSHSLVTLPPPCWTNTAHKHGVKVLGTFIFEWDEGRIMANKLLATKESAHMYAERLSELAVALGFDGWLLNFEISLDVGQIPNLKEFVRHLTLTMHSSLPSSLVIWYDSVCIDGSLSWQNQLNGDNKPFFDLCDGIFMNYTWKESYPHDSALVAGDRKFDVYMGIDVFGRGTFGGGQWTTNVALDVLKKSDVSAALFAPGWVYETRQPPNFETAQNRWWSLVEQSWGISQKYPKLLPFYSDFDQGRGYHISIDGVQILETPWNNISSQSCQPFLKFSGDAPEDKIRVYVDFEETSYNGGGNITFKGTLGDDAYFTSRLFVGELDFGDSPVYFAYSMKSEGNSVIGLSLEFLSATGEKRSVLLASQRNALLALNRFSSHFNIVIMPHLVTNMDTLSGWIMQESSVVMDGYTLIAIHAVCYLANPNVEGSQIAHEVQNESKYSAVLGHLNIRTCSQNPNLPPSYAVFTDFPPSTSWSIVSKYINWSWNSEKMKKLSTKLLWQLKSGNGDMFPSFNIYVQKLMDSKVSNGFLKEEIEYIGSAEVEAYYISDLVLSSGSHAIKFIIQICNHDGASQKLEDSPFLVIQVQDS